MNEPNTLFGSERSELQPWQRHEPSPPFVHHSQESFDAAVSVRAKAPNLRERVYVAIKNAPSGLTDEEISNVTGLGPSTARPRRVELASETPPRIASNGTRKTLSGRNAQVWVVTKADS